MNKILIDAAKKHAEIPLHRDVDTEERYFNDAVREYDSFIAGAEWRAEALNDFLNIQKTSNAGYESKIKELTAKLKKEIDKLYSEEDLKEAFKVHYTPLSFECIGDFDKDFNTWFEQFKKNGNTL